MSQNRSSYDFGAPINLVLTWFLFQTIFNQNFEILLIFLSQLANAF